MKNTLLLNDLFQTNTLFGILSLVCIIMFAVPENIDAQVDQTRKITGSITGEGGEELPGANVIIEGTTSGTVTDAQGRYTLEIPVGNVTIVFSSIGYTSQTVAVGDQSVINISMTVSMTTLDDLVVIGYGSQKKANLTGAVSEVDSEILENRPNVTIADALQGVVPNLNITQSTGSPGLAPSFNIRGNTSINGGGPLILVNGIPMDVNLINPNDIESVTVLKDAASAAIYGARGAYGVILITTKSGQLDQKPTISFDANYTISSPTVFLETMDSMEALIYRNTASQYATGQNYFSDFLMDAIIAHYNDPSQPDVIFNPDTSTDKYFYLDMAGNTDWMREIQKDTYPMQQYSVSVSGGNDQFDYYTSVSTLHQKGLARYFDEKYSRTNFLVNLNYKILDWMTVGTKVSMANAEKQYPPAEGHLPPWSDEARLNFHYALWPTYPIDIQPDGLYADLDGVSNPVQQQREGGYRTRDINDTWLTGLIKLAPVNNVTINFNYTRNFRDQEDLSYIKNLPFHNRDGTVAGYYFGSIPNSVTRMDSKRIYQVMNAYADYENTFDKHYFKAMIGYNQEYTNNTFFSARREDLIIDAVPFMSLASGQSLVDDGETEAAIRGAFSRLNYSFMDKYLFEFNIRYDGSSKFPKDDRFAFFPSAAIGWRVDNEGFFSNLKGTIDLLKFRASYGELGNQTVPGNYPYISTYGTGIADYTFGGVKPITVFSPGLVSPDLTWEEVTQANVGLDFSALNSRLSGSFDVYNRNTKGMLTLSEKLPSVLGVQEPNANAADMKTTGFDFSLSWNDQVGNVTYGATFVLSDYTSEITKFSNPSGIITSFYEGYKMDDIWGFVTGGLLQSDTEAAELDQSEISGRDRIAGDLWFVDLDGDGRITRGNLTLSNPGDQKIIGNSTPRYSYGLRPNISWKGFDLVVFLQGVAQRDFIIDPTSSSSGYFLIQYRTQWGMYPKIGTDYWTPENRDAYFPRPLFSGDRSDIFANQTRFMQNAAYLRLKQVSLAYTFPSELTQKIHIERLRLYATGTNLWTATKMVALMDPELNSAGTYPLSKGVTIGIKIDF